MALTDPTWAPTGMAFCGQQIGKPMIIPGDHQSGNNFAGIGSIRNGQAQIRILRK